LCRRRHAKIQARVLGGMVETRVVTKLKIGIVFVSETVYTFINKKIEENVVCTEAK
jgi:phenolic acid decarboxylase